MSSSFGTIANVTKSEYCYHCEQSGMVMLDEVREHASGSATPCPLCEQGKVIENAQWPTGFWGHLRDVDSTTWNRGMSILMRSRCAHRAVGAPFDCGQPTTGAKCEHHRDPVNCEPDAWKRGHAEFGALLAGFSLGKVPDVDPEALVAEEVEQGRFVRGQREARSDAAADRAVSWDGVPV